MCCLLLKYVWACVCGWVCRMCELGVDAFPRSIFKVRYCCSSGFYELQLFFEKEPNEKERIASLHF